MNRLRETRCSEHATAALPGEQEEQQVRHLIRGRAQDVVEHVEGLALHGTSLAPGAVRRKRIGSISIVVLVIVAVGFAWNLGVHYTGAVMGMLYAARSIALWPALILIAIFTILGAALASGGVEATVGQHIVSDRSVSIPDAIVIVLSAGFLTLLYNAQKIPTSTIQILVFCVVGVGLAGHLPIYWETIGK